METTSEAFLKHLVILEELRDKKDEIGLTIIKNPFEKLTVYLHTTFCSCGDEYYECRRSDEWETDVENLLEVMETILKGDVPVDVPTVTGKRKIRIED